MSKYMYVYFIKEIRRSKFIRMSHSTYCKKSVDFGGTRVKLWEVSFWHGCQWLRNCSKHLLIRFFYRITINKYNS